MPQANEESAPHGGANAPPPGLGDLAERFFTSLGITKERYQAAKAAWHLDPNCKCADRKRWLNETGANLGIDGVVVKLAKWLDGRR